MTVALALAEPPFEALAEPPAFGVAEPATTPVTPDGGASGVAEGVTVDGLAGGVADPEPGSDALADGPGNSDWLAGTSSRKVWKILLSSGWVHSTLAVSAGSTSDRG